jgi:acyl carrier protein
LAKGDSERIYRTGDLGRVLPDGSLVHLGRKDFQVKILGYRIEIAEIETALLDIEGVREAAVIGLERPTGEKHLVAYVVPSGNSLVGVTMLRRILADRLPQYMIPSLFVMLDALPRTPHGKIDRHALPAPDPTRPTLDNLYVAPANPTEKKLTEIWSEVLSLDRIGVHDNFFDLGGHSLSATQVLSRISKGFQLELSFRTFFESPTVADMATVIIEKQEERSGGAARIEHAS